MLQFTGEGREGKPITLTHFLSTFDLKYDVDENITSQPETLQVHVTIWLRTLFCSVPWDRILEGRNPFGCGP